MSTATPPGFLLDVREDDEWAAGHLPGSHHMPLAEVPARLDELPPDGAITVVCRSGGRSDRAAAWLQRNGYDAESLSGGLNRWAAQGGTLVSDLDTGAEPFVL